MSQTFDATKPNVSQTMTDALAAIRDHQNAVVSSFSGPSAPSAPVAGMPWYDTVNSVNKRYNGSGWDIVSTTTVATDTLWEAAGDLVVGTGANTSARLAVGAEGEVLKVTAGVPAWGAAAGGGASFWTETTGTFTATPASTSTLTMTTDLTATIKVGYPLKYAIGGTTYYGIVTAITSNLLTVAGAPLGGDVTALYYGNPERVIQATYAINGYFADAANTTLLKTDLLADEKWTQAKAYLTMISHIVGTDDSGANQPRVTAYVNGAAVGTSNTNAGEEVAETWTDTVVAINTSNYDVNYGETVEIATDANGSNNDAQNLTVKLTWVLA